MIQLSRATADRAEEIICAHFVMQQRNAFKRNKKAIYVDLKSLSKYAAKCAIGYRQNLKAARDFVDHEVLFRATQELLDINSTEYEKAK